VVVTVGHLNEPRYSVDVYTNGRLVRKKVDARMWLFRGLLHKATGYYKRVRFTTDVAENGLVLEFRSDDAEFHRLMEIEKSKGPDERPQSRLANRPLGPENAPFYDIGGPFSKISLMGLEIFPEESLPVEMDPETLELRVTAGAADEHLASAVSAYNSGNYREAEAKFLALQEAGSRGLGLLALAGRADYENEYQNAQAAVEALRRACAKDSSPALRDLLEQGEIFLNGLTLFKERGIPPNNGIVSVWRAAAEFDQAQPGDLLYYKSRVLLARFLIMLDAHQWCWSSQEGKRILKEVETRFPENRYVRFYLHDDLADSSDWVTPDYLAKAKGAPGWAAGLYAGYNHLVDLSEWWALNKQASDGSIGGGWGDDVEIVALFGYVGLVSEGASPLSVRLARNLMNGVYASGEIDTEGGFYHSAADSEHTAEYTGKTLPMMLALEYGNPNWFERALKTAKLMNDIWMGTNNRGHLHWRSNFLGASGIGPEATGLDSAINWRAAEPAAALVLLYGHPEIRKLILRHADSLYEDAMRTDKGKPQGIIPGDIDYETDEIGGRNVSTWYDPGDIPARGNYGFEAFHNYRTEVLRFAHSLTGDEKYIEPIRLQAEYARKHGGDLTGQLHKLEPGSPEWVAIVVKNSIQLWEEIQYEEARRAGQDLHWTKPAQIAGQTVPNVARIRSIMPYVTTEAIATDRLFVPGAPLILRTLMGWKPGEAIGHLTYRNVGRDFAAAVLGADATSITMLAYLFDFEGRNKKTLGLVPWKLELGAEYRVTWGPDAEGNGELGRNSGELVFRLNERGQSVDIPLETGQAYAVKIVQTTPTALQSLLPDLAVGPEDVDYSADWELLFVSVHNIGAAPTGEYEVLVQETESGRSWRAVGNALAPPLDLTPKKTRFGFKFQPTKDKHLFEIQVRHLKDQPEISSRNNSLKVEVEFAQ
jgi:hypothetical protein